MPATVGTSNSGVLAWGGTPAVSTASRVFGVDERRLHAPRKTRGGDEELPVPDIEPAHTAGAARTEHLLIVSGVGEPGLFSQNPFCHSTIQVGRRHDLIPVALRLCLHEHRERRKITRRHRLQVEAAQPLGVER
jgi:hypothetical protein